jgi:hypothetical protein
MAATTFLDSNSDLKNTAVRDLASIVQKVGIPLKSVNGRNPRYEALSFIVRANETSKTAELIKEISQLAASATEDIKKAACNVSYRIHKEVFVLLSGEMKKIELSQNNEEYKSGARAVHNLYLGCKSQHSKKHERGEVVNFAGVPSELIFGISP